MNIKWGSKEENKDWYASRCPDEDVRAQNSKVEAKEKKLTNVV